MEESYTGMACNNNQDGSNNTNGGINEKKRITRNTTKITQATEPERGTIRNILARPNIGPDKSRYVEFIESKYRSIKSKLASYRSIHKTTHTKEGQC